MSLRFVPTSAASAGANPTGVAAAGIDSNAAAVFGVHDTLRAGFKSVRSDVIQAHPLENHLRAWNDTQESMRLASARHLYGAHMPIRLQMEREIVKQRQRVPTLRRTRLAEDILSGNDCNIEFEDFLGDRDASVYLVDPHGAMERALGMSKGTML
ncbi:proteasome maturation factor UMP1-domain-containing protein [Zopfochytrium polystomum]|nr:proteasome maturation factor UMP1-domain-containing protein [Zopfochytrium polystomum]